MQADTAMPTLYRQHPLQCDNKGWSTCVALTNFYLYKKALGCITCSLTLFRSGIFTLTAALSGSTCGRR